MSRILDFYRGGPDHRGRRLSEIIAWDAARLEHTHDYIQWLFPLPEPSAFQPSAPLLTPEDAAEFRRSPELQDRMRQALAAMLAFYGVNPPGPMPWLCAGDHNFLRLTRILRSLRLAGLETEAQDLLAHLQGLYRLYPATIDPTTFAFWRHAVTDPLPY
ncbi:MAG: hypothetical protein EPN33_06235 [Acidobacteria bacterium]|nr:MAG: hypothetical protein EPN33_06235 [Acidobacteriota bacterium]